MDIKCTMDTQMKLNSVYIEFTWYMKFKLLASFIDSIAKKV